MFCTSAILCVLFLCHNTSAMSRKQHKSKDKKSDLTHLGDNLSDKKDGGDEIDQEDNDGFITKKYVFEMLKGLKILFQINKSKVVQRCLYSSAF